MAKSAAARRRGPRSVRLAYDNAGRGAQACLGFRYPALSPRLLPVFAVLPPADAVPDYPAWPARLAGTPARFHDVLFRPLDFDLGLTTQAGAAGPLCRDYSSWHPEEPSHPATGPAELPRIPRPHLTGKRDRACHHDCARLRIAPQDRGKDR